MSETDLNPEGEREPDADGALPRDDEDGGSRRRRRPRTAPGEPEPGTRPEAAVLRVQRARRERVVGGVCGGIAEAYGLDPGLVRLLAVLAAFVGGAGFVAYAAALLLLPLESRASARPRAEGAPRQDRALLWLGLGLSILSVLGLSRFAFFEFSLLTPRRGALWPLLLIASALLVVARRRRDPAPREASPSRFLARPRRDRLIAGVASGFARYARVDANLVRVVLLVVAVWSHGIGLVLYFALAALVPEEPRPM